MTLNLLTWVPEGLVLLTDSMSTSESFVAFDGPKVTTYDHARKLFELSETVRAAAMISGVGDIAGTLVSQLIRQASRAIDARYTSGEAISHLDCVTQVQGTISPVYNDLIVAQKNQLLLQINSNPIHLQNANAIRKQNGMPELAAVTAENIGVVGAPNPGGLYYDFWVTVPRLDVVVCSHVVDYEACTLSWPGEVQKPVFVPRQTGNVWWWGSGGSAVARIVRGFDLGLMYQDATNAADAEAQSAWAFATNRALRYQMPYLLSVMPLQEAVYFTEYLGDVAAGYDRFKAGPAGVGGAINIMIITDERRQWLRRDEIHSRRYNREENDVFSS